MTSDVLEIGPYQEDRPWGYFRRFAENAKSTVKIITVNPGESLSLQSHALRAEFWHVLSGTGIVEIDGIAHKAAKGNEFTIPVGTKHRLSADEGCPFEVLEIATGDFGEQDIVRYEDEYGRAN